MTWPLRDRFNASLGVTLLGACILAVIGLRPTGDEPAQKPMPAPVPIPVDQNLPEPASEPQLTDPALLDLVERCRAAGLPGPGSKLVPSWLTVAGPSRLLNRLDPRLGNAFIGISNLDSESDREGQLGVIGHHVQLPDGQAWLGLWDPVPAGCRLVEREYGSWSGDPGPGQQIAVSGWGEEQDQRLARALEHCRTVHLDRFGMPAAAVALLALQDQAAGGEAWSDLLLLADALIISAGELEPATWLQWPRRDGLPDQEAVSRDRRRPHDDSPDLLPAGWPAAVLPPAGALPPRLDPRRGLARAAHLLLRRQLIVNGGGTHHAQAALSVLDADDAAIQVSRIELLLAAVALPHQVADEAELAQRLAVRGWPQVQWLWKHNLGFLEPSESLPTPVAVPGDLAGLLALRDDPRPSRWIDRGVEPRTVGDCARRSLAAVLGMAVDDRLPEPLDDLLGPWVGRGGDPQPLLDQLSTQVPPFASLLLAAGLPSPLARQELRRLLQARLDAAASHRGIAPWSLGFTTATDMTPVLVALGHDPDLAQRIATATAPARQRIGHLPVVPAELVYWLERCGVVVDDGEQIFAHVMSDTWPIDQRVRFLRYWWSHPTEHRRTTLQSALADQRPGDLRSLVLWSWILSDDDRLTLVLDREAGPVAGADRLALQATLDLLAQDSVPIRQSISQRLIEICFPKPPEGDRDAIQAWLRRTEAIRNNWSIADLTAVLIATRHGEAGIPIDLADLIHLPDAQHRLRARCRTYIAERLAGETAPVAPAGGHR